MAKAILIGNNPVNIIGMRQDAQSGAIFLTTSSGWESHYPTLDEAKQATRAADAVIQSKARAVNVDMSLLDPVAPQVAQPTAPLQAVAQPAPVAPAFVAPVQ